MILACHHISKEYPGNPVLRDITFHLEKGDKAAIVGINGAGKTTLLKIIVGEEPVDAFDNYVEQWKALGGDMITMEVNAR